MTVIHGIKYCPEVMETKWIDHSKYYHKVMRELKEYKDKPRDWIQSTYYILESVYPISYYEWTIPHNDKDWHIIKYFYDTVEVWKFLLWLERDNHAPEYETKDAEVYIQSYQRNH